MTSSKIVLLLALFVGATSLWGCSLLGETPEIVLADAGTLDASLDSGLDLGAEADSAATDAGSDVACTDCPDLGETDPLEGPEHVRHEIGLVTETNAKFADRLNVLFQFERLVYPEDEIATLANEDSNFPDHDLFLIRTGGVEPLRASSRPVITFAPWAEDDLLLSAEPTARNYITYSEIELVSNELAIPEGSFAPFVTGSHEGWLGTGALHADGVSTVGHALGSLNDVVFSHAAAGSTDISGEGFAGDRIGLYFGFHRRTIDTDSEPAFDIWTSEAWGIYTHLRARFLPDEVNRDRQAIVIRNGQTAMGFAVIATRLERLGFEVTVVDESDFEASENTADLFVLWPGVTDSLGASLPGDVPILAFPVGSELMVETGFLEQAGSTVQGLEHRWHLQDSDIVPPADVETRVEMVNTNETTLSLPAADVVLSIPESRIAPGVEVLARLAENGNVTAFVVSGDRRRGYLGLTPSAVARANVPFIRLFDRVVFWLVGPTG